MSPSRPERPNKPSYPGGGNNQTPSGGDQSWRWIWTVLIVAVLAVLVVPSLLPHSSATSITYSNYLRDVKAAEVSTATIDNSTGVVTGKLADGTNYTTQGPNPYSQTDVNTLRKDGVPVNFAQPSSSILGEILPYVLLVALFAGVMWLMTRQARGQMSGIMSIGRSRPACTAPSGPRPPSPMSPDTPE